MLCIIHNSKNTWWFLFYAAHEIPLRQMTIKTAYLYSIDRIYNTIHENENYTSVKEIDAMHVHFCVAQYC